VMVLNWKGALNVDLPKDVWFRSTRCRLMCAASKTLKKPLVVGSRRCP